MENPGDSSGNHLTMSSFDTRDDTGAPVRVYVASEFGERPEILGVCRG